MLAGIASTGSGGEKKPDVTNRPLMLDIFVLKLAITVQEGMDPWRYFEDLRAMIHFVGERMRLYARGCFR